jgi:hypothetical protein
VCAATLLAGCTGQVGTPGGGGPGATGSGNSTGGGNSTGNPGAGGSGVAPSGGGGSGVITGAAGTGIVTPTPTVCNPGIAATSQIARLTNLQYERTIYDLLGVTAIDNAPVSSVLATEQAGGLTDLERSAYDTAASKIAAQVMASTTLRANFMKCTPTGDGKQCLYDTIAQFGRRAFRRPLAADDTTRFRKLVDDGAMLTATGTPTEIAELVLYAFLVSPSFLQRNELTESQTAGTNMYRLTSHEIASRLSYTLWGSTPDAMLDQAADAGQLSTPEQIRAQAMRMVMDPKARNRISEFHRYYLHITPNSPWNNVVKDTTMFSFFTPSVVPTMIRETEVFFDEIAFVQKGTFQDLLLSPVAFVNKALAPYYGLSAANFTDELKATTLDMNQRPGFLTRAGFLNAYAAGSYSNPIKRGAFVMKDVLGIDPGSPPPGAEMTPLPAASDSLNTNRKRFEALSNLAANCMGCHVTFINPPGFALEAFNAAGLWQTMESWSGQPIDTSATVVVDRIGTQNVTKPVTGPAELMAAIAASPAAQHQYAKKLVSFAFERNGNPLDCGTVNSLADNIAKGSYPLVNVMADLSQSESFRIRAVEATP